MIAGAGLRPIMRSLLGLAGLLLLAGAVTEMVVHGSTAIWPALLGLIGPDLAFLAGIGQPHGPGLLPRRTVLSYNLLHRLWLPLVMVAVASFDGPASRQAAPYLAAAPGWLGHIALDRALWFNLRAGDGSIRT